MKKNLHIISRVLPDGIGEELELEPGDALLSINGQPVEDVFDYRYLMNDEFVTLLIRKKNGEEWELEVEKEYEDDLGVEFDVRKVPNDSKKDLFDLINKANVQ
mgnify:CR=1 FL=1